MATLFVRHQVADVAAWRRVYDGFEDLRRSFGVLSAAVYQAPDSPTDLTVVHDFASLDAAKAFSGSTELRSAMHDAGVVGAPTVWFAERV